MVAQLTEKFHFTPIRIIKGTPPTAKGKGKGKGKEKNKGERQKGKTDVDRVAHQVPMMQLEQLPAGAVIVKATLGVLQKSPSSWFDPLKALRLGDPK